MTGVCVVSVEPDASAGLLITVTTRPDVDDDRGEVRRQTADADTAVAWVEAFLRGFGR